MGGGVCGAALGSIVAWVTGLLEFCTTPASDTRRYLVDGAIYGLLGSVLGLFSAWPTDEKTEDDRSL
jgi:hypothetical protein